MVFVSVLSFVPLQSILYLAVIFKKKKKQQQNITTSSVCSKCLIYFPSPLESWLRVTLGHG